LYYKGIDLIQKFPGIIDRSIRGKEEGVKGLFVFFRLLKGVTGGLDGGGTSPRGGTLAR